MCAEKETKSAPQAFTSMGLCGAHWQASTETVAPAALITAAITESTLAMLNPGMVLGIILGKKPRILQAKACCRLRTRCDRPFIGIASTDHINAAEDAKMT